MNVTVNPGEEKFLCRLVTFPATVPAKAGYVTATTHHFTPGSHHLLLYATDLTSTSMLPGWDQPKDCSESGPNASVMNHVKGLIYDAQNPTGGLTYPPGIGFPATPNQVLLWQVHYIDPGATPLDAHVTVDFTFAPPGATIKAQAGVLFWYDTFIDVPAGAKARAQMRCPIPNDITILRAESHYHSRGMGYGAYLDDPPSKPATTPFFTSHNWEDPGALTTPFPVKGGSNIRFECDYDNTAGSLEFFAGPSAKTNEMCMFIGLYYPDLGSSVDNCNNGDLYGTGTSTCTDTYNCLVACSAAGQAGMTNSTDYPPCVQKCFAQSCPSATGPVNTLLNCLFSKCAGPCTCDSKTQVCTTATSSACTACVQSTMCSSEWAACQQPCP
jgi:hypothetical protein